VAILFSLSPPPLLSLSSLSLSLSRAGCQFYCITSGYLLVQAHRGAGTGTQVLACWKKESLKGAELGVGSRAGSSGLAKGGQLR
jgi:hypothetical protein